MKLYIHQKVISWGDRFRICDEWGNECYWAQGQVLSFGKKLHLYDAAGREQAFLRQQVFSLLPRYTILRDNVRLAVVRRKLTLLRPQYSVSDLGWTVRGDFTAHEYRIFRGEACIAAISKRWLSWGDTYEIRFPDTEDPVPILSVVLIIDAALAQAQARGKAHTNR